MSDYARANSGGATHFGDKDSLTTGDANKVIVGAQYDSEFEAIVTAVATKYDSTNIASQAEAEAESSNTVLLTPLRLANWADATTGIIGDIQAVADPGEDALAGWDDGAGAGILFTAGAGIVFSTTTITVDHDAATNFVADEHIAHAGVSITAGTGLTGGGTIASTRTLNVIGGNGITANADDIAITDQAATTSNPIDVSSGTFSIDVEALTTIEGSALAASDTFLVDDGGTPKGLEYQDMGLIVQTGQTTQTLAAADMNTLMEFNGTATLTIPLNATTALPVGASVLIVVDHATQVVTVTADTSVTLNSVFHPGGGSAASDIVLAGGMAVLTQLAADDWYLSGDINDS